MSEDAVGSWELKPGPPAIVVAVAAPVVAVTLVGFRAAASGLSSGPDDPVSPMVVAAFTIVVALIVSWRALTSVAFLGGDTLRCRNVSNTFEVTWDRVESLDVVHRPGLVVVDIRVRGLRRRHRLGAATRFPGHDADTVLDILRAHPTASRLVSAD